ncbi:hypothetical protein CVS30_16320 [Arthrobacter psychrolactophilus]|uniref:Phage holin family protein n=1 Tax=Arthrobacter psychrolactophilus TaxID=92442 RepID=A0A2V5IPE5_9MICC|nr:phage holin family protein [Arthrobacter psychrolactophilus]PYI37282.1 hypothetical protein CVS30_16320 [Arthrobacter psychrolactophilus]
MTEPRQEAGTGLPDDAGAAPWGQVVDENAVPRHVGNQGRQAPRERPEEASLGELLGEVSRDMSTLMRQELELAKAELRESATRAGKGAGMLVGASEAARFTLLFLSLALWATLAHVMDAGWSAVIVAVVWAVVAAILALLGKKNVTSVRGLPATTETVQEIPGALKPGKDMT